MLYICLIVNNIKINEMNQKKEFDIHLKLTQL